MPNLLATRLAQIRTWGLKGIVDYVKRIPTDRRLRRIFTANAAKFPQKPTSGLTLIADMTGTGSLSKVMRDLAFRLRETNIPYQTYDLHQGPVTIPAADYREILSPPEDFRILRYSHVLEICTHVLPPEIPLTHSRIYFWEFDSGLLEYDASLAAKDDLVAMSDFNRDVFRASLPETTTVKKLLYPFVFNLKDITPVSEIRKKYGLSPENFVVFFNFDFGTSYKRKNPEDALRAFAKAFPSEKKTRFVFKAKNAARHPQDLSALWTLAQKLGVENRIQIVTDYLPMSELYGLTNACDVYLSLHRGEGFGLGIAEAMSLGKPVIVTNYSATTEFCNDHNSISVPFKMIDVQPGDIDNPCYRAVKQWAQPDIDAAALALRSLFDSPSLRTNLGQAAKNFIQSHFSTGNFKQSVLDYLAC